MWFAFNFKISLQLKIQNKKISCMPILIVEVLWIRYYYFHSLFITFKTNDHIHHSKKSTRDEQLPRCSIRCFLIQNVLILLKIFLGSHHYEKSLPTQ